MKFALSHRDRLTLARVHISLFFLFLFFVKLHNGTSEKVHTIRDNRCRASHTLLSCVHFATLFFNDFHLCAIRLNINGKQRRIWLNIEQQFESRRKLMKLNSGWDVSADVWTFVDGIEGNGNICSAAIRTTTFGVYNIWLMNRWKQLVCWFRDWRRSWGWIDRWWSSLNWRTLLNFHYFSWLLFKRIFCKILFKKRSVMQTVVACN